MNDTVIFTISEIGRDMYEIKTKNLECKYMENRCVMAEMLGDFMTVISQHVNNEHKKACLFEMD